MNLEICALISPRNCTRVTSLSIVSDVCIFAVPLKVFIWDRHALYLLTLLSEREHEERVMCRQGDRIGCLTIGHTAVIYTGVVVVYSRGYGATHFVVVVVVLVIPPYGSRQHICRIRINRQSDNFQWVHPTKSLRYATEYLWTYYPKYSQATSYGCIPLNPPDSTSHRW